MLSLTSEHVVPLAAAGRALRWRPTRRIAVGLPVAFLVMAVLCLWFGLSLLVGRVPGGTSLGRLVGVVMGAGFGAWLALTGTRLLVASVRDARWNRTAPTTIVGLDDVLIESGAGAERLSFADAVRRDAIPTRSSALRRLLEVRAARSDERVCPEHRFVTEWLLLGGATDLRERLADDLEEGPGPLLHVAITPAADGFTCVGIFESGAAYAAQRETLPTHRVFLGPTSWDAQDGSFVPTRDPGHITELT